MTSEPTTVNTTAQAVNTGISITGNAIVSVVQAMILVDVPALGFPVFKQLWEALFNWIAGYFIRAAQNGATFEIIDAQVASEETNLSGALTNLIAAEKTGDSDAVKKAIQAYADAHSALVHSDGSASAS